MDDLAAKLGELLQSPGALDNIKNLAGLLGGNSEQNENQTSSPSPPVPEQSGGFPGIDGDTVKMVSKLAPLLSSFRREDDNTRFLHALRPMLCPERQKKLDEAIKLLQLMRVLPLLKDSGLF